MPLKRTFCGLEEFHLQLQRVVQCEKKNQNSMWLVEMKTDHKTAVYTRDHGLCERCCFIQIICAFTQFLVGITCWFVSTVFPYPWPCFQFTRFWLLFHLFSIQVLVAFFVSVYVHSAMLLIDRRLTTVAKSKLRRKNVRNAGMPKLGTQPDLQFISSIIACKLCSILLVYSHAHSFFDQ